MPDVEPFEVVVKVVKEETPRVRSFTLARPHDEPLPSWDAGAHVDVLVPGVAPRSYSLINVSASPGATVQPVSYRLGILQDAQSCGGSRYMHALQPGAVLTITPPSNNFALEPGAEPVALLAGGIGVTPLLSMASALAASGRLFSFHYAGRSRGELPFLSDVKRLGGDAVHVHADDEAGGLFDLKGFMAALQKESAVYLCGPLAMIEAAIGYAKSMGWAPGRLRFEIFAAPKAKAADETFEVELKSSGRVFRVPPDKTILDVLIEAGEDPMHDCRRGDCGICQTAVLDGVPDHRDYILSDSEKASNKIMQICISRAKSPRLVLDL